ncbi:MAG: alkaline phosphatase family protein [Deltaproteobacteria bacterium]|nr:alkaline phosphatase family protein [Deltaproteobacteria bacterium]
MIVFNYPCSWPPRVKNGIVVGGAGLTPNEWRTADMLGLNSLVGLCIEQVITTSFQPLSRRIEFEEAEGWENTPESEGEEDLAAEFRLRFSGGKDRVEPTTWYLLVQDSAGDGYDRVTLSPTRDFKDAFFTISKGEWSKKIYLDIKLVSGEVKRVHLRAKLLELSDDAEEFSLYLSALGADNDEYTYPPGLSKEFKSDEGLMAYNGGYVAYSAGVIDLDTYMEINHFQNIWLADVVCYLLENKPCDLFTMHAHAPDWFNHAAITDMDPLTQPDEQKREKAWNAERKMYQSLDEMIGRIVEAADKDAMIMLVSDHGAVADGPPFNPYLALEPAGLVVREEKKAESKGETDGRLVPDYFLQVVNWEKTKAYPQRECYIYINLKGRDPDGIVEPEEYEAVQQQIIDALLSYKDPESGKRPVALALSKKDARIIGLYGDRVGDVVYALNPFFGAQHGQQLPASEYGIGDQRSIMVMYGPGFKKGYRLKRNMWLTDVVPTICHALNWPMPEDVEGAIVYQVFEDPNFQLNEISKLRDGLAEMEKALAQQDREPTETP